MAQVTVTVKDGVISCDPDKVSVTKADQNLITFTLATDGYTFPESGAIVMKKESTDFPEASVTQSPPRSVKLTDLNQVAGDYAYSVKVLDRSGKAIELDPEVKNDGGG